jgi:hypothetical protein
MNPSRTLKTPTHPNTTMHSGMSSAQSPAFLVSTFAAKPMTLANGILQLPKPITQQLLPGSMNTLPPSPTHSQMPFKPNRNSKNFPFFTALPKPLGPTSQLPPVPLAPSPPTIKPLLLTLLPPEKSLLSNAQHGGHTNQSLISLTHLMTALPLPLARNKTPTANPPPYFHISTTVSTSRHLKTPSQLKPKNYESNPLSVMQPWMLKSNILNPNSLISPWPSYLTSSNRCLEKAAPLLPKQSWKPN